MYSSSVRHTITGLTLAAAIVMVAGCSANKDQSARPSATKPAVSQAASPSPAAPAPADTPADTPATAPAASPAPAQEPGTPAAACTITHGWNTVEDDGGLAMSRSAFYLARAGRHACYDRVVFDVNGSDPVGFHARYVPVVRADASGARVPVAGRAALEVIIRAPIGDDSGDQSWRDMPRVGDPLVSASSVASYPVLRGVTFAGSFEGQTTVAVGVSEKRPFRVWTLREPGYRHVVLDIAH